MEPTAFTPHDSSTLKKEATFSSETFVTYLNTRRHFIYIFCAIMTF